MSNTEVKQRSKALRITEWNIKEDLRKATATLQKSQLTISEVTLGALRAKIGTVVTQDQSFCYSDGSSVDDDVKYEDYLEINGEESTKGAPDTIYVKPPKEPAPVPPTPPKTVTELLAVTPFIFQIYQWAANATEASAGAATTNKGSLHSKSIENVDKVGNMTLAGLRKLIPGMSSYSAVHMFCTPSGATVTDEKILIPDYLVMEPAETTETTEKDKEKPKPTTSTASPQSFKIYYKTNQALNNPTKVNISPDIKANTELTKVDPGKVATPLTEKTRVPIIEASMFLTGSDTKAGEFGASYLDDKQWDKVLQNCGVFYGWIVDRSTNRIVRAPKAAFKLRSKIMEDPIANLPDYAPNEKPPANKDTIPPGSSTQSQDIGSKEAVGGAGVDPPLPVNAAEEPTKDPAEVPDENSTKETQPPLPPPPQKPILRTKADAGIPNFRVNDDSRIEITAAEHEFEVSMARNDFSSQSTEASMSGGYAGFSVGVSAGYASSKSKSTLKTEGNWSKTFVARYLYPRCDLFLYADDLEPSPDLVAAIERVRVTKNIKDLRRIHADYGHLFCQNLTLGGRLQSSKIAKGKSISEEETQKEQFKVSVGVTVATPVGVGASVKRDQEQGKEGSDNKTDKQSDETNVFEAVGGDTILANNPGLWAPTVAKHQFWRVINRDGMAPLADIIADIPGYREVKSWFIQAVPAISKYIELDDSRQVMARFRLTAPTNGLSKQNEADPSYYLGHDPSAFGGSKPRLMGVDRLNFWGRMIEYPTEIALFGPANFRAPVLQGYSKSIVGGTPFGAQYNAEFTHTEWNILAPFSESLTHGSRIILRTNPYIEPPDPNKPVDATKPIEPPKGAPVSHIVVFRNQQGVFLPGMSDSDENQYWRILKVGAVTEGEHIKEGDEVRFCWVFKDQLTGFRDYRDDIFGRRRNQCPPELESSVLYLKLPWPRFESTAANTMMLSPVLPPVVAGQVDTVALEVLPARGKGDGTYKYVAQDVRFRIDTVANEGLGDSGDYLLKDIRQENVKVDFSISLRGMQIAVKAFYF
ncbi:hypothetical protein B0J11DRAFT_582534 [Dendryphion nanum]|uniref:MACPF-like domain-containing protein n=1 Tax=Dendryphion nanum TaxID=256645 RepID=A0A9P9DDX4_9PLEO|nr:hypothetical protein B0J11DRAFT_582534 [Dendryphion nanum]